MEVICQRMDGRGVIHIVNPELQYVRTTGKFAVDISPVNGEAGFAILQNGVSRFKILWDIVAARRDNPLAGVLRIDVIAFGDEIAEMLSTGLLCINGELGWGGTACGEGKTPVFPVQPGGLLGGSIHVGGGTGFVTTGFTNS